MRWLKDYDSFMTKEQPSSAGKSENNDAVAIAVSRALFQGLNSPDFEEKSDTIRVQVEATLKKFPKID